MKILLSLFISLLLITPCLAQEWFCVKDPSSIYIHEDLSDDCKSYTSYKLKRPIVNRSNKKYKNIVKTSDSRRFINYCKNY